MTSINNTINGNQSSTQQELIAIFEKVKLGKALTILEQGFLDSSSKAAPPLTSRLMAYVWTPADQGSVEKIDLITRRVLNREAPVANLFTEAEQRLRASPQPTIRETASLAKLIDACLYSADSFTGLLSRFRSQKGRDPTRGELIQLVAHHNKSASPTASNAGQAIVQIRYFNENFQKESYLDVKYNREGRVEIVEGPIAPLDAQFDQVLTPDQIREMRELYQSLAKETPYNNLGELLEFSRYFKEQQKINPNLTWKQALAAYQPHLGQIFDKYHSGTCILLSTKFKEELAKKGIKAQILSTSALNPWTSFPIPGMEVEIKWEALSEKLKGVDHSDIVCFFKDEKGEGILRFRCSFEKDMADEVVEYRADKKRSIEKRFLLELGIYDMDDFPNQVINEKEIGKNRLLGRHKALIKKDEMILGIDFMRGNIYFRPKPGIGSLKGLPFNRQGRVSIEIAHLSQPDMKGIYIIDGVEQKISHRDALQDHFGKSRKRRASSSRDRRKYDCLSRKCSCVIQ